jgi:hypothetical protein
LKIWFRLNYWRWQWSILFILRSIQWMNTTFGFCLKRKYLKIRKLMLLLYLACLIYRIVGMIWIQFKLITVFITDGWTNRKSYLWYWRVCKKIVSATFMKTGRRLGMEPPEVWSVILLSVHSNISGLFNCQVPKPTNMLNPFD